MPTNDTNDDPVVNSSLSVPLLVSTLILMLTLVWALYDELYTMRPGRATSSALSRPTRRSCRNVKPQQAELETQVKDSSDYQQLEQGYRAGPGGGETGLSDPSASRWVRECCRASTRYAELPGAQERGRRADLPARDTRANRPRNRFGREIDQVKARVVDLRSTAGRRLGQHRAGLDELRPTGRRRRPAARPCARTCSGRQVGVTGAGHRRRSRNATPTSRKTSSG